MRGFSNLVAGILLALGLSAPSLYADKDGFQRLQHTGSSSSANLDRAISDLKNAKTKEERFYALGTAAKECFMAGKIEAARKFATELMSVLPKYKGNWNYGNAVHDAHLVLGRIAVRENKMDEALRHLLDAGKSPGSPQMNAFGPNMSLARDLFEKGEREIIIQYFEDCRKFWKSDEGRLDRWTQAIKAGKMPDFGPNLVY